MRKLVIPFILITSMEVFSVQFSLLGGSEADTKGQSYSYVGFIGEKSLSSDTSLLGKLWVDYLVYKFRQDSENIRAQAPAFQLAGGLKRAYNGWSISLWTGWERRDTNLSPDRKDVKVRGVKDGLVLQFELDGWFENETNVNFITSYSSSTSYLWARGRIKKGVFYKGLRLGLEVIGQGNKDYRAVQSGALMEISTGSYSVGVKGGYKNSSKGDGFYTGVEVYVSF